MKHLRHILLLALSLIACLEASAQFYSWGADAESLRWRQLRSEGVKIIYPDTARVPAYTLLHYVKALQPAIGFGFEHGPMRIPFVIHPENMQSNGLVMWLPKRVEILSAPAIETYSMPWLKQLAAHEYRHAVQYNNLNRGVVKAFSFLLGQQSSTIGLLFMPLWAIEGDAVVSETAFSSFGRALQPSFTLHYRAVGESLLTRRNTDKWFCGSFREHIPDHYYIGYQVTAYADTKYDENVWNKVTHYAVRRPYVFATTAVALKKYYNTSTARLVRETFEDLNAHWATLPTVEDSAERLATPRQRSYTTYRWPQSVDEHTVLSLKESLDTTSELVLTNTSSGEERRLCYTGNVSSRPSVADGRVWWSEYHRSTLFAERVTSRLCYHDIDSKRFVTLRKTHNALYPAAISDSETAWIEYSPDGSYFLVRATVSRRRVDETFRHRFPFGTEIHSLAYDRTEGRLYVIALSDEGMYLARIGETGDLEPLTEGSYTTLSDLRAEGGRLYFGSIASGKDEAHCYDIASGKEYRLTTSRFGSFSPSPAAGGGVLLTTYDRTGYHLSRQSLTAHKPTEVAWSKVPVNVVNPPRRKWNTINLDTVRFAGADSVATCQRHRSKRFSKFAHLVNIHSWAPLSYDPYEIVEEGQFNFNLGATVLSQSLLSSAEGFATWGWNKDEHSFYKVGLRYYGLGMNFGFSASYGGRQRMYYTYTYQLNEKTNQYEIVFPDPPHLSKYYNIQASALLPLYFQSRRTTRLLTVSAVWNYSNGLVAKLRNWRASGYNVTNLAKIGFYEGLHSLNMGISYQSTVRLSHKDFLPPFGCILSLNYAFNPVDAYFSDLISLYAKGYIPGFFAHHSLSLALSYQTSIGGFRSETAASKLSFQSSRLIPRGFSASEINNRDYLSLSLNYQLPLCYPEGGIPSVLYFKRIRLNVGFDHASFIDQYFRVASDGTVRVSDRRRAIYSYGGDLTFDVNFFRMPASATSSVTLSIYKPQSKKGVFVSAGVGLPF